MAEGNSIKFDISLIFQYGGVQGVNQDISLVRLEHTTVSSNAIFYCGETIPNGGCSDKYVRITYNGTRSPWTNISVNITNSTSQDSGTYRIEVYVINPIGSETTRLSSYITVSITKG